MIIEVNIFYTNTRVCGSSLFGVLWPEEEQQTLPAGPKGISRTAAAKAAVPRRRGTLWLVASSQLWAETRNTGVWVPVALLPLILCPAYSDSSLLDVTPTVRDC